MGWARTLLLGDIGNRLDIADTERDIGDIRHELGQKRTIDASQTTAIEELREENTQLELAFAALVKSLQRKSILTDEEVRNLVEMIDPET